MNGKKFQSLSTAGSVPFSTPNQLSISGPLLGSQFLSLLLGIRIGLRDLAWWNPTTQIIGANLLEDMANREEIVEFRSRSTTSQGSMFERSTQRKIICDTGTIRRSDIESVLSEFDFIMYLRYSTSFNSTLSERQCSVFTVISAGLKF